MEYKIQKSTNTYADTLEAVGTADLLGELTGVPIRIEDIGDAFRISVIGKTAPIDWKPPGPGYPFIFLRGKDAKRPQGRVIDYESERQKSEAFRQYQQAKRKKNPELERALKEQGLPVPEQPTREYRMANILASMRMGWDADKKLYLWIVEHPDKALDWVKRRLTSEESIEPPIRLTNSQFFSPSTGKGVHAAKTVAKSAGGISKEVVDPFSEWMKYRGAYSAMLPYRSGKDIKVYVIEPGDIGVDALRDLRNTLMDLNLWGGIRLDIESSLRLAEQLILKSDVMGRQIGLRRRRPNEVVRGLRQAFFKNLGTASALMNDAFMPLPGWFVISDRGAANAFLGIIEEHIGQRYWVQGCLGSLRDEKSRDARSGDIPVLQQYRKWLATGELSDFLEFTARFAVHVFQAEANTKKSVKRFSFKNLNELLLRGYVMKTQEIVTNQGFLSVARAIRNSTMTALYLQRIGKKGREVRYGLAQEWKQKIKGGLKTFLPVLSDFVQQYNWEAEHFLKKDEQEGRQKVHQVRKEELDEVIRLLDNDTELVGMLLLAYGFSWDSKKGGKEPEGEEIPSSNE